MLVNSLNTRIDDFKDEVRRDIDQLDTRLTKGLGEIRQEMRHQTTLIVSLLGSAIALATVIITVFG